METNNVLTVTDDNFKTVLQNEKLVLIDFNAEWCSPCKALKPVVAEIAEEYKDSLVVCALDIDDNPNTAVQFGVTSIPTLLLFKEGELIDRLIGAQPKRKITAKIDLQKN